MEFLTIFGTILSTIVAIILIVGLPIYLFKIADKFVSKRYETITFWILLITVISFYSSVILYITR